MGYRNANHGVSTLTALFVNCKYKRFLNSLERELIGCFLLKMADNQVVSARSSWYVDKRTLRREFEQHLLWEPNSTELRVKLSINGSYNVSI